TTPRPGSLRVRSRGTGSGRRRRSRRARHGSYRPRVRYPVRGFLAYDQRVMIRISTESQLFPTVRPWQALDPAVSNALSPVLGAVADEITAAIAEAIPEYRQPMGG